MRQTTSTCPAGCSLKASRKPSIALARLSKLSLSDWVGEETPSAKSAALTPSHTAP